MALTVTQKNTLRLMKQSIDRAAAKRMAVCRKQSLYTDKDELCNALSQSLDTILSDLMAMPNAPTSKWGFHNNVDHMSLIRLCVDAAYTGDYHKKKMEQELLKDLWKHAAEYAMLSQMPPPKREYVRRGKRTLVERRADAVDKKIREWKRKLTLAKNKLAAYRKKQKYYAKKGAVNCG